MLDPAILIKLHHLDVITYAVDSAGMISVKARCIGREVGFIVHEPRHGSYTTRRVSGQFALATMPPWWARSGSSTQIMCSYGIAVGVHEEGFASFDVWWDTEEADLAPLIAYAITFCTVSVSLLASERSPTELAKMIRGLWLSGDKKTHAAMPGLYRDGTP